MIRIAPQNSCRSLKRQRKDASGCARTGRHFGSNSNRASSGYRPTGSRRSDCSDTSPLDAATDRTIAQVFVASHALHPTGNTAFDDLMSDMKESQLNRLRRNVKTQWPDLFDADQKAMCREILIDLVDQNIERLNERVDEFEKNADDTAARIVSDLKCDQTPAGERLRNYILKSRSGLKAGFANYRKHQEELKNKDEMTPTRTPERMRGTGGRTGAGGG